MHYITLLLLVSAALASAIPAYTTADTFITATRTAGGMPTQTPSPQRWSNTFTERETVSESLIESVDPFTDPDYTPDQTTTTPPHVTTIFSNGTPHPFTEGVTESYSRAGSCLWSGMCETKFTECYTHGAGWSSVTYLFCLCGEYASGFDCGYYSTMQD
ncbi:Uu.00g100600.m01.CDS01 [Anthostomella pinea]|uniref:Uu.00g100600.m01.CDS01 n=1 Tax=Anthostomella pinea TaxID=933095 RepID=A0AAI8YFB6_9PEZI|nr:Uu.00g100600.m01.CDS01 [Anthostomella pinea]